MKSNLSDSIIPAPDNSDFTKAQIELIIELAWEDRTPFEAIESWIK